MGGVQVRSVCAGLVRGNCLLLGPAAARYRESGAGVIVVSMSRQTVLRAAERMQAQKRRE